MICLNGYNMENLTVNDFNNINGLANDFLYLLYLKQNRRCALSGRVLSKQSLLLDLIDDDLGYIYNNVQWINKDKYTYNNKFDNYIKFPKKIVAISGGMDVWHTGHLLMAKEANTYGITVAILNSDEWLIRKKGYFVQTYEERKTIGEAFRYIDLVVATDDSDGTVCEALNRIRPDYFANGGDRQKDLNNVPEAQLCNELGIQMLWEVGGNHKQQSSSSLINNVLNKMKQ